MSAFDAVIAASTAATTSTSIEPMARAVNSDRAALVDFFEERAPAVDAGRATVREGLAFLGRHGLAEADIVASMDLVSTVARSDMASAFSAWAHRMVIDYLTSSPTDSGARAYLPALATADTLGATALAAGTAHVLAGVPLPVTYRADGDDLVFNGRIPWASNLIAPFLIVTAAADVDDPARSIVAAIHHDAPGLDVAPYPSLLALDATGSSTVKVSDVRVSRSLVIAYDLPAFVRRILARFLLLQGAFCSGLAHRSLEEAEQNLGHMGEALRAQLDEVSSDTRLADAEAARLSDRSADGNEIATGDLLVLRLRWSELATAAVRMELTATGGRGYLKDSSTARRVREAAFLPIQAPTEVLLRWLLSRSA